MGLLLRHDAYYTTTSDGLYMMTEEGSARIGGAATRILLDRLRPYLNGRYGYGDLTSSLAADHATAVMRLVQALRACGAVRWTDIPSRPEDITGHGDVDSRRRRFFRYFASSGDEAATRYEGERALVVGGSELLPAVVESVSGSGLRAVDVVDVVSWPAPPAYPGGSERTVWQYDPASLSRSTIESLVREVNIVFHADQCPGGLSRAMLLEEVCGALEVPLVQAIEDDDEIVLTRTERGSAGWTSAWLRRCSWGAGGSSSHIDTRPGPTPALVASQMVHDEMLSAAGRSSILAGKMTRFGFGGVGNDVHRIVPHPVASEVSVRGVEDFSRQLERLSHGEHLDPEDFSRRAAQICGSLSGVIGEPTEQDIMQVPLRVSRVDVSDPMCSRCEFNRTVVTYGAGLTVERARLRAALYGLAKYASAMIDPRRLPVLECERRVVQADPQRVLHDLRNSRIRGWDYGYRLIDRTTRLVDVKQCLASEDPSADWPAGLGAGYHWRQAIEAGLLSQCHELTMAEVRSQDVRSRRIDVRNLQLDEPGIRYRALLARLVEDLVLYEVMGTARVTTVLCFVYGRLRGTGTDDLQSRAVAAALEEVLLWFQSEASGQPQYRPAHTETLTEEDLPSASGQGPLGDPIVDYQEVVRALSNRGSDPTVVLLDHDPQVYKTLPYMVRVVL